MGEIDPSTALKPRSPVLRSPAKGGTEDGEEWGKKTRPSICLGAVSPSTLLRTVSLSNGLSNGSGSTLSMPHAEARGSRRVDTERGEGYKLARHGILLPSGDSDALAEALLFALGEKTLTIEIAERARKHKSPLTPLYERGVSLSLQALPPL